MRMASLDRCHWGCSSLPFCHCRHWSELDSSDFKNSENGSFWWTFSLVHHHGSDHWSELEQPPAIARPAQPPPSSTWCIACPGNGGSRTGMVAKAGLCYATSSPFLVLLTWEALGAEQLVLLTSIGCDRSMPAPAAPVLAMHELVAKAN